MRRPGVSTPTGVIRTANTALDIIVIERRCDLLRHVSWPLPLPAGAVRLPTAERPVPPVRPPFLLAHQVMVDISIATEMAWAANERMKLATDAARTKWSSNVDLH